jgi:circadian clock protein KaiB
VPLNPRKAHATFEQAGRTPTAVRYVLRLYVTGMTARSARAVRNLRTICDEYLEGRYDLEVVDIYQQPVLIKGEQIIAAPTLISEPVSCDVSPARASRAAQTRAAHR